MTLRKNQGLSVPIGALEESDAPIEIEWAPASGSELENVAFPEAVAVTLKSDKVDSGYAVEISVNGRVALVCDRCGTEFLCPVAAKVRSFYTYSESLDSKEDEEVHLIAKTARKIDFTQDAWDAVFVSLPDKKLCRDDCEGLCAQCGADLNEAPCQCQNEEIDPRWEGLKGLTFEEES